jgi:tRNA dimethylallyltransferase
MVTLEPTERRWLHARIAERMQTMLRRGLVDEVRALRARGDLHLGLPSMRCVGYRQVWEALDQEAETGRTDETLAARAVAATRQLAKRQLTWLRSISDRQVVACDAPDAWAVTVAALRRAAAKVGA